MTEQEREYFIALSKDRQDSAKTLEKPSMRGVKKSVSEKYSDQAHFIYELLQNADDAGATQATFDLQTDQLVFSHDGTRRFTVTDPEHEDGDTLRGGLGDINAITSIANSNKRESSIGKFGVGFKAVFQYTRMPEIYDRDFRFRIERFIVPIEIEKDFPGRGEGDTLFVFPFDHPDRNSDEAYGDIEEKLKSLTYPVLFLTHLKKISYRSSEMSGEYSKTVVENYDFDDTNTQLITIKQMSEDDTQKQSEERLWLFTRSDNSGNRYSVGYSLNDEGALLASDHAAFCFFPTREATGLNFIIHAPFLLNDSREGIKAGEAHNKNMVVALAELAADSLVHLRDIGIKNKQNLITDDIVDIIPYDEKLFADNDNRNRISFMPFYETIQTKLCNEPLLPSPDGYVSSEHAYWLSYPKLAEVFSNEQLATLCGDVDAKWVFSSLGREELVRSKKLSLATYLDAVTTKRYSQEDVIGFISDRFIEAQPTEWLGEFYKYIADSPARTKMIRQKPIFPDTKNKAAAAFDEKEQAILFLPTEDTSSYRTIRKDLLENKGTIDLVKALGIEKPSLHDEIYNIILPQYEPGEKPNTVEHFKKFIKYYNECPRAKVDEFLKLIRDCKFIRYRIKKETQIYRGKAADLYIGTDELREYFSENPDTKFVDMESYESLTYEEVHEFLLLLGVKEHPRILERELSEQEAHQLKKDWARATYTPKWREYYIDGCEQAVTGITPKKSIALWN